MATTPNTTFVAGYPSYPMAANAKINSGDIVLVWTTGGTAAGYAVSGSNVADAAYVGIAVQSVTNGTVAGGVSISVYPPGSNYPEMTYLGGSPTQAIVGLHVYAYSNQTVALQASATNVVCVGKIVAFNQQGDTGTVVIDDTDRFSYATTV